MYKYSYRWILAVCYALTPVAGQGGPINQLEFMRDRNAGFDQGFYWTFWGSGLNDTPVALTSPGGRSLNSGYQSGSIVDYSDFLAEVIGTWTATDGSVMYTFEVASFDESAFPTTVLTYPQVDKTYASGALIPFVGSSDFGNVSKSVIGSLGTEIDFQEAGITATLDPGIQEATISVAGFSRRLLNSPITLNAPLDPIDDKFRMFFRDVTPRVDVHIVAVPEPSTAMLALLSTIGLFNIMSRTKRTTLVRQGCVVLAVTTGSSTLLSQDCQAAFFVTRRPRGYEPREHLGRTCQNHLRIKDLRNLVPPLDCCKY